jgi:preprotein translocase subunit SecA
LKYDDVMNRQRHAIYGDRRKVLEGEDVSEQLHTAVRTVVDGVVRNHTEGFVEDWDLHALWTDLKTLYPVSLKISDYEEGDISQDDLVEDFVADAEKAYQAREDSLGEETMRELERRVLLTVLDRKWRDHLYEMDYLREGIGLRAMAQRDPLVEYQREGGLMFNNMMDAFMEEVVGYLFNLQVQVEPATPQPGLVAGPNGAPVTAGDLLASGPDDEAPDLGTESFDTHTLPAPEPPTLTRRPSLKAKGLEPKAARPMAYSAPSESGEAAKTGAKTAVDDPYAGVGRNAPCPCGSGKKYKMCHGRTS